ncbi:MAG: YjbQ family protein [Bacteroidetes bacterium]|nr:MAG: YjbQ family protein [Bacteroidota bacterium]
MKTFSSTLQRRTKGFNDIHDMTEEVRNALAESQFRNGIITVFIPGSTAGITTIEFESGAISDLTNAIERLAPKDMHYQHDARWGDGNGFSHVRAAVIGPSLSVPFNNGTMQLGTWQQIILIDFDNRPRTREVIVQIIGE